MAARRSGSILSVDFGNVHTRAVLIDLVEGAYRVVATSETRTTIGFPVANVVLGMRRAVDQITQITGRRLQESGGRLVTPEQPDRSGVDAFLATASIGRPLRTVLIGLMPDISVASGERAIAGTYVDVVETLNLSDSRTEEEQLNAIVASQPDLIFITGGTEAGARGPVLTLARVAALALPLMRGQRTPVVLYAGNSALVPEITALFDDKATLLVAPNVRPNLDDEELDAAQMQLARAFDSSSSQRSAGFETVGAMSRLGILPTAQTYNLMTEYLGQALPGGIVMVDIGSATSIFSAALEGRVNTVIRTDFGLGHSAADLLNTVGIDAVRDWLPFYASDDDILAYALNKTLRPGVVPENVRELYYEHAFLRAAIQALVRAAGPLWDTTLGDAQDTPLPDYSRVIGAGAALARTGRPGLAAMLLLDALAPTGVTILQTDGAAVLPALGAVAHINPAAVVQVLESNGLERLGVAFNLSGEPRTGRAAMHVKITPLTSRRTIEREVEGGQLWVYYLPPDERARVEISVNGRGLSIGGKRKIRIEVGGGTAGLIFDARGRDLPVSQDLRTRATQMPLWLSQATGDAVTLIDESWLTETVKPNRRATTEVPAAPAKAAKPDKKSKKRDDKRKAEKPPRGKKQPAAPAKTDESDEMDELRDLFS
jgi:uncharacterized protein (TIGR01319 family)